MSTAGTVAWVESPFQLLSAIEAASAGFLAGPVEIHARGASTPYDAVLRMLDRRPVRGVSVVTDSSIRRALANTGRATELAIGDLCSGQAGVLVARARARRLVVLDDGSSTLAALAELTNPTGVLVRPRSSGRSARVAVGRVLHRIIRGRYRDRVAVVTGLPVDAFIGSVPASHHAFGWTHGSDMTWGIPDVDVVVLGTALAADGLIDDERYVEWLNRLLDTTEGRVVFFPHRREGTAMSEAVRRRGVMVGSTTGLPIEMILGQFRPGTRVATLPSTTVFTVPTIAPHLDVECWPVPDAWWTPHASLAMRRLVTYICDDHVMPVDPTASLSPDRTMQAPR